MKWRFVITRLLKFSDFVRGRDDDIDPEMGLVFYSYLPGNRTNLEAG